MPPPPYVEGIVKLLSAATKFSDEIGELTESESPVDVARACLFVQCTDIASSFVSIASTQRSTLTSRAILLRAFLEARANWEHIGEDKKRAQKYVDFADSIDIGILRYAFETDEKVVDLDPPPKPRPWTASSVDDRVAKMDRTSTAMYGYLSNFTHCNNVVLHFQNAEEYGVVSQVFNIWMSAQLVSVLCDIGPLLSKTSQLEILRAIRLVDNYAKSLEREESKKG